MWLYIVALVLLAFGVIGGILTGGIFTIVFIPLGVIMLITAVLVGLWGRAQQARVGGEANEEAATDRPLPRHPQGDTGRARTSPEALAEARRVQQ